MIGLGAIYYTMFMSKIRRQSSPREPEHKPAPIEDLLARQKRIDDAFIAVGKEKIQKNKVDFLRAQEKWDSDFRRLRDSGVKIMRIENGTYWD